MFFIFMGFLILYSRTVPKFIMENYVALNYGKQLKLYMVIKKLYAGWSN
jgi:hypothetical protein